MIKHVLIFLFLTSTIFANIINISVEVPYSSGKVQLNNNLALPHTGQYLDTILFSNGTCVTGKEFLELLLNHRHGVYHGGLIFLDTNSKVFYKNDGNSKQYHKGISDLYNLHMWFTQGDKDTVWENSLSLPLQTATFDTFALIKGWNATDSLVSAFGTKFIYNYQYENDGFTEWVRSVDNYNAIFYVQPGRNNNLKLQITQIDTIQVIPLKKTRVASITFQWATDSCGNETFKNDITGIKTKSLNQTDFKWFRMVQKDHLANIALSEMVCGDFCIKIFNSSGQNIYKVNSRQSKSIKLRLPEICTGVYFIHCQYGNYYNTQKFIIH